MAKTIKKIASVALPIVGALTGNPLLAAAGSALGSKLGGGSWGQALTSGILGGVTGGIGNGFTGSSMLNTGIGFLDNAASGINSFLSPIGSGIKGALGGLGDIFTGAAPNGNAAQAGFGSAFTPASQAGSALSQGFGNDAASVYQGFAGNGGANIAGAVAGAGAGAGASQPTSLLSKLIGNITSNPIQSASAGLNLANALNGNQVNGEQTQQQILDQQRAREQQQQQFSQQTTDMLNSASTGRSPTVPNITDYYTYGQRPEASFFTPTTPIHYAKGGYVGANPMSGGQDDDVDAKLSHGEFVVPADVVSALGDGATNSGATKLHKMLTSVRKHKTGSAKFPPKAKPITKYMGALSYG